MEFLLWLLVAFVAGGYVGVLIMSLTNIASFESDRADMAVVGDVPGANAILDD